MSHYASTERHCTTCGSQAGADDVYCRFCGSRLPASQPPAWETSHEDVASDPDSIDDSEPDQAAQTEPETAEDPAPPRARDEPTLRSPSIDPSGVHDSGQATPPGRNEPFAPPPTYDAAPPQQQRDSRLWWILGAAVVIFLLICCCLLFAIAITASQDSGFRDELQSVATMLMASLP